MVLCWSLIHPKNSEIDYTRDEYVDVDMINWEHKLIKSYVYFI